ncbi:MAG: hypothetical protein WC494_01840 [Candidatus Pacearchaeota archaeon]
MKIWLIALIMGTLVLASMMVVNALQEETPKTDANNLQSCGSCGGNCNALEGCSLSTCGINNGGSCGCKS